MRERGREVEGRGEEMKRGRKGGRNDVTRA